MSNVVVGVGCVFICNDEVLLLRGNGEDHWKFPGGKVEHGESLRQALRREIKEEIGWDVTSFIFTKVFVREEWKGYDLIGVLYRTTVSEKKPIVLAEKEIAEYAWVKSEDMKKYPMPKDQQVSFGVRG